MLFRSQAGVDVVEVNNGKLRFTVVPTRGMNVHELYCGDVRLGWNSPVTELVNPLFINPADRGGLGWLDGFNEWMTRCGYEFAGHPGEDGEKMLTLHGKASNLPASKVEVFLKDNRLHVRGRVEEKMFKFVNLEMCFIQLSKSLMKKLCRFNRIYETRREQVLYFELLS